MTSQIGWENVLVPNKEPAITRSNVDQVHWRIYASPVIEVFDVAWTVWVQPIHSADSSIKLSDHHTTQTQTSEVRWAARFSGHWVVGHQHVCVSNPQEDITQATNENLKWKTFPTKSILVLQTQFKF